MVVHKKDDGGVDNSESSEGFDPVNRFWIDSKGRTIGLTDGLDEGRERKGSQR